MHKQTLIWLYSIVKDSKTHFDKVSFVYSFLYITCSKGHIGENIAAWNT